MREYAATLLAADPPAERRDAALRMLAILRAAELAGSPYHVWRLVRAAWRLWFLRAYFELDSAGAGAGPPLSRPGPRTVAVR